MAFIIHSKNVEKLLQAIQPDASEEIRQEAQWILTKLLQPVGIVDYIGTDSYVFEGYDFTIKDPLLLSDAFDVVLNGSAWGLPGALDMDIEPNDWWDEHLQNHALKQGLIIPSDEDDEEEGE